MISMKNFIGDSSTKVAVIINFLNHILEEDIVKVKNDRSKWVERAN